MQNFSSPVNLERLSVFRGVGYVNTMLNKTHFLLCENLKQYVYVCVRSLACVQGGWGVAETVCAYVGNV